jgi:hypothetical protein
MVKERHSHIVVLWGTVRATLHDGNAHADTATTEPMITAELSVSLSCRSVLQSHCHLGRDCASGDSCSL